MSSPRKSYYNSSTSYASPRTSTYTSSSSPRTSSYSSTSYSSPRASTYSSASPRSSTYTSSSPRTSSTSTTSYSSPRTSTYSPSSRIHDITNSSPSCDTSPYTKLKQVIRKNHDLKVSARLSMQDKENAVQEVKAKATHSIDELRQEIAALEDKLLNKTYEVKALQSKLSYAVADHSNAFELEHSLRNNAQANCRVLEVKVRKSNDLIRKYKDEICSLKSQLEHQSSLSRKYEQRSLRLRKKLSTLAATGANLAAHEDIERMRAEVREARTNKTSSAYYDLWRGECDNARALRKELAQTQKDFDECDKELVQLQEDHTVLTATARNNTHRLQKRVARVTNKSSLNTFILLMVLNSTLKKVRKLESEQQDTERKLIAGKEEEITDLKTSLSEWGDQWRTVNSNVSHRMSELMGMLNTNGSMTIEEVEC